MSTNRPQVALVYDRVNTPHGGAEKVLLALHELYPDAPLYTSVYDPNKAPWASVFTIKTTLLQHLPTFFRRHRWLVPLMPLAFESLDLSSFDIVISVTSAEAKGILTKPTQLHLCYLLTPTRYLYSHEDEYASALPFKHFLTFLFKPIWQYLKWWDQAAASRPDVIVPISQLVAYRTQEYYHRQTAPVVYPPLELPHIPKISEPIKSILKKVPPHYFLVISRLVAYKKIDVAIQSCRQLGRDLIIVGTGPERQKLAKLTHQTPGTSRVIFLDACTDQEISALYTRATALLMPGEEDFGIAAIEAVAHGVPVIIHHQSGAAELIKEDEAGIFITEATTSHLVEALHLLETGTFKPQQLQQSMQKYATTEFLSTFKKVIDQAWQQHRQDF